MVFQVVTKLPVLSSAASHSSRCIPASTSIRSAITMLSTSSVAANPRSTTSKEQQPHAQGTSSQTAAPKPFSDIPKTKTTLGLNIDLIKKPSQLADYLEKSCRELGPIFKLAGTPGLPEMVCIVDPGDVETVYRTGDTDHPQRQEFPDFTRALQELGRPKGLFFQKGEEWYKHRIPISKFIMMPRKMAEYHEPFNQVSRDYLSLVRRERSGDAMLHDVTSSLGKWSLESIAFFSLGKRLGCLGEQMPPDCQKFVDDFHRFTASAEKILFGIPFHRIWKTKVWKEFLASLGGSLSYAYEQVMQKLQEMEQQTQNNPNGVGDIQAELGMDFVTYMMYSGKMSVEEVAVHSMDLLTAGVDTTSVTMAGCAYLLATNPEVQEKLREEVWSVVGSDQLVTPEHIQAMHYLRDTIKETTRMLPVAPNNTRMLKEEVVLSGYKVPAGVPIVMPIKAPGHLSEFFPEPDSFKPERWNRSNTELPNSFSSLPFGFGRRSCIGRRVAELEMHILLAQLMKNFRIEYRDEKPMEFATRLFYGPARKMDLAFIDIENK